MGTAKGEEGGREEDNGDWKRKGVRWRGTRRSTGSPTSEGVPIRFGTYNIQNGRNGGLESALRRMAQANIDLGIFHDTKCTDGIYTRASAGYIVVATDAPIRHRGGVAIIYWPSPHFAVEAVRQFGPNVVGFQLETGAQRWYIIGCYLYPDDTLTVDIVVAALKERPRGAALLVAVDLNTTLMEPENYQRGTDIAAAMTEEGLEDTATHFLPRRHTWGRERRTRSRFREEKVVRSRTDYILGTDCRLFYNMFVREPRHNTDHYMVLGCLRSSPEREHTKYLTGRKRLPLQPPSAPTREDGIFAALRRAVPKPQARDRRKNGWISEDTLRIVNERVSVRRKPAKYQTRIRRLSRAIATSLKMDRRRRFKTAGAEVEKLLEADPSMPREVW